MDSRGWSKSETRCLISSWAEESVQQKLGDSYHNRLIYEDISNKLKENGYSRTWLQCQRKIKHLKHLFRKAKDSNKSKRDRASCPFYDELEKVLENRPSFCPGEGDVLDLKPEGSLIYSTVTAIADAATFSNTTPAESKDGGGDSDGFLPLSSLRLIVPPLQLVSAALWEILKQGAVMYYGLLEDFVTTVLETVPELLTYTERVQLLMGLRAKVVLDLCRNDDFASPQAIQPHLSRINTYITNQDKESSSSEIKALMSNFLKLVHTLVDDQCQRDIFYQKTFPTVFGPNYDSALQALMRKFLFNLQKLLPVPNLEQTSQRLGLSPTVLKECVDFMNQPEPLNTLIQHHKHHGHKVSQALSSSGDDCILSSLSFNLPNVDNDKGDALSCEPKRLKEETIEEINSESMSNVERNGQQHDDDVTEDEGAFVEVILQPFDESESTDDDDMDKTWFHHLKTGRKTSSKTFKCLVCGQDFSSRQKLRKHKITHSGCFRDIDLHPKPNICVEKNASRSEGEFSSCASSKTHNPSNLNSLQAETSPQCSTSLPQHAKLNPADKTKESFLSETGSSNVAPQESTCPDSQQEQTGKRSRRVKQCSNCGKIFTCSADLMRHMRCHTQQNHCFHCGKDFDSSDEDCEVHQEGKCNIQNQDTFVSNTKKKNQENNISSGVARLPTITHATAYSQAKSPMTCQECGQDFSYYKSFEKHKSKCSKRAPRRKRRFNTDYFVINGCNFRSADSTNESHAEISSETKEGEKTPASADGPQTKSRSFKCTMCEKNFSNIAIMNRHYSQSHKVRGPYPCPICKGTFVRLCELVRHLQNKNLYQCAVCNKCFPKPGQVHDHEKIHTACRTPRICETCGRSFKYLAHLVLHQRKHRDRQPTVCSYCGKQFSSKDCLKAHMVRHLGGFPCPVCGKKFNQKTYLKWHLYKHTGQAPYLCETCGKGWPSAAQLKLHMIQHTEERPFKCEDCGVAYKRESHLIAHRRAKHIRLRPFVCEVCSKAFRLNNELKKHMMVHTGERPFTCPRCDKTFTRKSRLREHREKGCLY
ncbi:zinc finger protein 16-like isoform X1 [Plectropomus leopardus]|uniref:zinc finger protein 16-like isoform X1 n=1 Tax=Plectropomus leopardus TaxID=160734 RepID=UPI001C4BB02E|nr:zinc finger protein 16-like isoform X1 [Plectropomus leopardus]